VKLPLIFFTASLGYISAQNMPHSLWGHWMHVMNVTFLSRRMPTEKSLLLIDTPPA